MRKWFKDIESLDELRKAYRKLAILHHPDKGGSTEAMQEINNEYDRLSKKLINSNADFSESRKTYEHQVSEELREKVAAAILLDGVIVEIIGSWIWLTGKTKEHKEAIKEVGFKFSPKKIAWYWHCGKYRKLNGKEHSLSSIRAMFGSEIVERENQKSKMITV